MADQCKQMKKRPTVFTDLSGDELSCIFIIVAQFGAAELAMVMAVCRLFSQVGKSQEVLRALNFERLCVTDASHEKHRQINGMISLAAEAGHSAAQYLFAEIILMSCEKLTRPLPLSESRYGPDLRVQDASSQLLRLFLAMVKSEDQTFMSQLSSKPTCDNKGLYHYQFVRIFLSQCNPSDFSSLYQHLRCYKVYCEKDSDRSRESLKDMRKMCDILLGYEYNLVPLEWAGTHGRALALLSLEELRSKALQDLDDIFRVQWINNENTLVKELEKQNFNLYARGISESF